MKKVFVLGSINMDLLISTDRMPMLGESKPGYGFLANQGGKGANQAIAVKKLGLDEVHFIGSVGDDSNGIKLKEALDNYQVNTAALNVVPHHNSGVCVIIFDDTQKDNILVIEAGANHLVDTQKVRDYLFANAQPGDIFITQLEINLDAVYEGLKAAKEIGMYTILNPAPACKIDENIYRYVDLISPNETETKLLTGIEISDLESARLVYNSFKTKDLIITLGSKGSFYLNETESIHTPAHKVQAVDTTCAGDTFIGAIALNLANGKSIKDSLKFASYCSSITVSRKGAGISIPSKEEVLKIMEDAK